MQRTGIRNLPLRQTRYALFIIRRDKPELYPDLVVILSKNVCLVVVLKSPPGPALSREREPLDTDPINPHR